MAVCGETQCSENWKKVKILNAEMWLNSMFLTNFIQYMISIRKKNISNIILFCPLFSNFVLRPIVGDCTHLKPLMAFKWDDKGPQGANATCYCYVFWSADEESEWCSFLHISIVSTSVALHISTGWAPLPKLSRSLVRRVAGLSDMFNGVGV